jgi:hypothetical protein
MREALVGNGMAELFTRFPQRLFEWMTALMMLGIAATIGVSPRTIESGGFHLMQDAGITRDRLGWAFLLIGILRIGALYANGRSPFYGPWCRFAGAFVGALVWLQMGLALVAWSDRAGYVSIGVPVYAVLALGEFISCYRAANDARSS